MEIGGERGGFPTFEGTEALAQEAPPSLSLKPFDTGDFTVTGGVGTVDYSYTSSTLTILRETALTISGNTSTDKITIASNVAANITLDGISINVSSTANIAALEVDGGSLNLTLLGTNTLMSGTGRAGLQLTGGADLTITAVSTGRLTATGGGGTLVSAAGIGAGNGTGLAGDITINGGTITAHAGTGDAAPRGAAGIGGGINYSGVNSITITGGTIEARGDSHSAGIGGGMNYSGVNNITITGGTIDAISGGSAGAGIGGGYNGNGMNSIIITGGSIRASSFSSAGIGGGDNDGGINSITVSGGAIEASSSYGGAGIGGGSSSSVGTIDISGGAIKATGATYGGAGIGGGFLNSNVTGDIHITGGTVTASRREASSQDIGNGFVTSYPSYASAIVIDGGSVWATNNAVAYGNPASTDVLNSANNLVCANTLTLGGSDSLAEAAVTGGAIDGVECAELPDAFSKIYGIREVMTDDKGRVCFWLSDTGSFGATGTVGLIADGAGYELEYARPGVPRTETLLAAPALTDATPTGSSPSGISGDIVLSFSAGMDTGSSAQGDVVLRPPLGAAIMLDATAGAWSNSGTVYTIPYSDLAFDTAYTIEISGFKTIISHLTLPFDDSHDFMTMAGSYAATLSPDSKDFGTATVGYVQPAAQEFTITNTGTAVLDDLSVFLEGPYASAFLLTLISSPGFTPQISYSLAPGQHITVQVHPVTGLAPRDTPYITALHASTLTGIDLSSPLTFTVKASGGGGGGGGGDNGGDILPKSGDTSSLVFGVAALALFALGISITTSRATRSHKQNR